MIAAHYIGLLLLSTAEVGSPEQREIIEANSPGIWLALRDLGLVEEGVLTERGRALVDHILALPLPEQVTAWRMPIVTAPVSLPPIPWAFVAKPVTLPTAPQPDDDNYVHTSAPVSMLPKVDIPTDPTELEHLANQLLNRGYGLNEVTETLKLSPAQAKAIFGAT